MDYDQCEALMKVRRALPMSMAQNAASIGSIHLYGIADKRNTERWTRQKVAYDRLQMAVDESATRRECGEPVRISGVQVRGGSFLSRGR